MQLSNSYVRTDSEGVTAACDKSPGHVPRCSDVRVACVGPDQRPISRCSFWLFVGVLSVGIAALLALGLGLGLGLRQGGGKRYKAAENPARSVSATDVLDEVSSGDGVLSTFFVLGNWGRVGSVNQTAVARLMAAVAEYTPPDFIVSVGDNFLPAGLKGNQDAMVQSGFLDIYNSPLLDVPWYAILGNNDYGDGLINMTEIRQCRARSFRKCNPRCCYSPLWQVSNTRDYHGPSNLPERWFCDRTFSLRIPGADLDLVFIDTTPLIPQYYSRFWALNPGGISTVLQQEGGTEALKEAIIKKVKDMSAGWRLVFGHHPIFVNGSLEPHPAMKFLTDVFHDQGVHVYFQGHDLLLEHVRTQGNITQYVTSGTGSGTKGAFRGRKGPHSAFASDNPGFVSVQVFTDRLLCHFYTLHETPSPTPAYTTTLMKRQ